MSAPSPVVKGTSPTLAIAMWVGFAGFWLLMVAVITVVAWDKIRKETFLELFLAVFWVAGLFLAGMAFRAILHARRFGSSFTVLDGTPARLGGWLSGVVRAPLALQGAETQLEVSCIETVHSPGAARPRQVGSHRLRGPRRPHVHRPHARHAQHRSRAERDAHPPRHPGGRLP